VLAAVSLTAFTFNVRHYASLGDDAYISFRYSRHLVDGLGLVWNPGERVEGYTNFLWVLLMAAGMKAGVAPEQLSNALGVASGALVLVGVAWLSARGRGWADPITWLAPLCLGLSRSFGAWSTGGLETAFFTLLVFAATLALDRELAKERPRLVPVGLLFALAALTRPEGLLFGGIAGFVLLAAARERGTLASAAIAFGAPLALILGAHFVWRHAYYGYWLPNTFYAKVGGFWWDQSLRYFRLFHDDYAIGWFLPLVPLAVVAHRTRMAALAAAVLGAYLAYIVYIGGDRFEFRFLVVVFPFFYWLLAEGVAAIPHPAARATIAAALVVTTHLGSIRAEAKVTRASVASVEDCKRYGARRAQDGKMLHSWADRGLVPGDLRIAVGGAGGLPYYTDFYTVDVFGLNDATIAHEPLARRGVPGHEHSASPEYLRSKRVDLIDVLDGPIVDADPERLRRKVENGGYTGALRCLEIEDHYLAFATTLTDDEFRARFAGIPSCEPGT
jgi:hypothetical protein